ncbi:protein CHLORORESPIRATORY REDUCTION 7, chloroplastic [Rhododendron vialii]|uniref:protein CHLORORESPIRATORY REDUCTION 7, chloroplastic n=1 Tax=Rhododendron vialii TaxID=182163 RepID=UPI00265E85AC|nr:protein CHLORORESPIRATORY REDUCTION 7, chloroplastic [Rhododendron vialii]
MEGAAGKLLFADGIQNFSCQRVSRCYIQIPCLQLGSLALAKNSSSSLDPTLTRIASKQRESVKVYARRRRSNIKTGTYLLLEPGKNEEFVSEEELRDRLKGWLDNWPGQALPPDLAKFENTDDAVTHLVKYVCELEIDGDVGSIQWFEVRLE